MIEYTIATAGHVDHGKSSLVKTLTGVDPDTLKEEKERGLTIEPTVVPFKIFSDIQVAFVDLPGHEDFIKNMVRGASCVDAAILVVAADDGVMPQTREHLQILKFLDVRYGFVVLSKVDLVDEETRFLAIEEIKELIKDSFLADNPIIPFSAWTKQGEKEIIAYLQSLCEKIPPRSDTVFFRLPIDRVLQIPGQGTVVTGTVLSGSCRVGQVLSIYPEGKLVKIKGLQVHRRNVTEARTGQRVGINLAGHNLKVEKGMILAENGLLETSHFVNALFVYTPHDDQVFENHTVVRLYLGTMETTAKVVLMERDKLLPGEKGFVQFRCKAAVSALPGDRFVVRSLSPAHTIGGGMVVEVTRRKFRQKMRFLIPRYHRFCQGVDVDFIEALIKEYFVTPVTPINLFKQTGTERIYSFLDPLLKKGKIIQIGDGFYHIDNFREVKEKILSSLKNYHQQFHYKIGPAKEELKQSVREIDKRVFEEAIVSLLKEGKISRTKGRYHIKGFLPFLKGEEERLCQKIEEYALNGDLRGFTFVFLQRAFPYAEEKRVKKALTFLIDKKAIVQLNNGRFLHQKLLKKAWEQVKTFLLTHEKMDLNQAKNLLNLSRQYTIAILDYLDTIRLTLRVQIDGADYRILAEQVKLQYKNKGVKV